MGTENNKEDVHVYKALPKEEVKSILQTSYKKASSEYIGTSGYYYAMSTVETCLQEKSPIALQNRIENGSRCPVGALLVNTRDEISLYVQQSFSMFLSTIRHWESKIKQAEDKSTVSSEDFITFIESVSALPAFDGHSEEVENGNIEVPYLIQKVYFDNQDVFFSLAHRDYSQPEMLAYYRSLDDLSRGKKTFVKPGKFFMQHNLGIEKEALEFSQQWISSAIKKKTVFFLSECIEQGGLSEENWEYVYKNTSSLAGSCMTKRAKAARVYADNPDLDIAFITETDKPFEGSVLARTIVRRDNKSYIRIYSTKSKLQGYLAGFLNNLGFFENRDMSGVTLKRVLHTKSGSKIAMPYIDGDSYYLVGKPVVQNGFKVLDFEEVEKHPVGSVELYRSREASGSLSAIRQCKYCNSFGSSVQGKAYLKNQKGKTVSKKICKSCKDDFIWDGSKRSYYKKTDFKFIQEYEWSITSARVLLTQEDIQNYEKITCQHLLKEMYSAGYGKEFLWNEDDKAYYVKKGHAAMTYEGDVTASESTGLFNNAELTDLLPWRLKNVQLKYSLSDRTVKDLMLYTASKQNKLQFLKLMLERNVITQEEHDSAVKTLSAKKRKECNKRNQGTKREEQKRKQNNYNSVKGIGR